MEDVADVISAASVNEPKGAISGPEHTFPIYDNDQLTRRPPWNDVIVAYRNGAPVRIRDIGVAVDGPENTQMMAWQNGKPGIMLQVLKQPGANIIDAVKQVDALLRRSWPRCRLPSKWIASSTALRRFEPRCTTWSSRCSSPFRSS